MADFKATVLGDRAVLRLSGNDCASFLQGLVTADVAGLAVGGAGWAALLTPQGKILFDFLVLEQGDGYLLDCAVPQLEELRKRLAFYKLRAAVSIEPLSGKRVVALPPDASLDSATAIVFADPRISEMGNRAIISDDYSSTVGDDGAAAYRARRIALGIPDTIEDIGSGVLFPHEANLDQLGGVSFSKGCYVGQEVVSRMEHRGTARKRIVPVEGEAPLPASGANLEADGVPIGTLGSVSGKFGLAMIRLDRAEAALAAGTTLTAGGVKIALRRPSFARFAVPVAEVPA